MLGTLMIISAVLLCVHNVKQSKDAGTFSESIVEKLKKEIPDTTDAVSQDNIDNNAEDLFAEYEADKPNEQPINSIVIDDASYCGYLSLPSLGLELPVMTDWSYPDLQRSPCRYSGSAESRDLIIAAHNDNTHFGRRGDLATGDEIIFTDTLGNRYFYSVSYMEMIEGKDVEQMFSGQSEDWDLTLFTCTLSGQSRVTIRADLNTDQEDN
ncbi:MAG: sortase [Ruminococcus sp.]|nr:sortase [Ruminococcus sp.]